MDYTSEIAARLGLNSDDVAGVIALLQERSDGFCLAHNNLTRDLSLGLDDVASIHEQYQELHGFEKRRSELLRRIKRTGKTSAPIFAHLEKVKDIPSLEAIYHLHQEKVFSYDAEDEASADSLAGQIWKGELDSASVGAQDTNWPAIAAFLSLRLLLDGDLVIELAQSVRKTAKIACRASNRNKKGEEKYRQYFDCEKPLSSVAWQDALAIRAGQKENILRFRLEFDDKPARDVLAKYLSNHPMKLSDDQRASLLEESYSKIFRPYLEKYSYAEFAEKIDHDACRSYAENLFSLLMEPPLGPCWVLGIYTTAKSGCFLVAIDGGGELLASMEIHPFRSKQDANKARKIVSDYCQRYRIEALAIGKGPGSREMENFLRKMSRDQLNDAGVFFVRDGGVRLLANHSSLLSDCGSMKAPFRFAIALARMLQNPLFELLKIEPEQLPLGPYQKQVNQALLKNKITNTILDCLFRVGVDINLAPEQLLSLVPGLSEIQVKAIVSRRKQDDHFDNLTQLKQPPVKLSDLSFDRATCFLRLHGGENPLDALPLHPDFYPLVEKMVADAQTDLSSFLSNSEQISQIKADQYVDDNNKKSTLEYVLWVLSMPSGDPRGRLQPVRFDPDVLGLEDLKPGIILDGVVTNVTDFGAFVNIGVGQDGLVHVSEMSYEFIDDPQNIVTAGQATKVKVIDVDLGRKRISLSIKQTQKPPPKPAKPPAAARRKVRAKTNKHQERQARPQKSAKPKFDSPFSSLYLENGVVKLKDDKKKKR